MIKEWIEKLNSGECQGTGERADCLNYIVNALLEVFDSDQLAAMVENPDRVKIMPCEIGDDIYVADRKSGKIIPSIVNAIEFAPQGRIYIKGIYPGQEWRFDVTENGEKACFSLDATAAALEGADHA